MGLSPDTGWGSTGWTRWRALSDPGSTIRSTTLPLLLVAAVLAAACGSSPGDPTATATVASTEPSTAAPTEAPNTPTVSPTDAPPSAFEACRATMAVRPELTWVVDKTRALPDGYVPADLVVLGNHLVVAGFEGRQLDAEAAEHFEDLVAAALEAGFDIRTRSSYRSFDEQVWTFAYWIEQLGQTEAERVSAKPGHSEHQLGTTADVTIAALGWQLSESLGTTPEGVWLIENAYRFGFGESYPVDGEPITGYAYEPWHLRYVGIDCATAWHDSDLTLVEFLEGLAQAS